MKIENHWLVGEHVKRLEAPKNKVLMIGPNASADSIILHYTADRNAEKSAIYLAKDDTKASAHIVLGRDGEIYQLVPFNVQSWHAGESEYGGRKWYNKFSIGIEIDNAGELKKNGNTFTSWFGRNYDEKEVIYAKHRNRNYSSYWHNYPEKQIEICEEICELLLKEYPIKSILGHEEIAPTRKSDPGPAFPLDRFRNKLLNQNSRNDDEEPQFGEGKAAKVVVNSVLNIREMPFADALKVAKPLPNGKEVVVLEEQNGWYRVRTQVEGWVNKGFIKLEE